MSIFTLPSSTHVGTVIPKNAFDKYTNTKEKKDFVDKVDKIRWTHKLSRETTNLPESEVKEIQIFEVLLRTKDSIKQLIKVMDQAMPYPIIFLLLHENEVMVSVSEKHIHPTQQDTAVIDWTFTTPWFSVADFPYPLELKKDLNDIFSGFCARICDQNKKSPKLSVEELIRREKLIKELRSTIQRLESAIARSKQFNRKVELNIELGKKVVELDALSYPESIADVRYTES